MSRSTRLGAALAAALFALGAALSAQGQAPRTYSVDDAKGLVGAIGPDRTIVLRKGDYRLSLAYGSRGEYASWRDADKGKELVISGLRNLTIRGAYGARIVSDSPSAAAIVIEDSVNVSLDNLAFARAVKGGAEVTAAAVRAESVDGLVVDRCSVEGPAGLAIELADCPGARVKRLSVKGAARGFLSAVRSSGLEVVSAKVAGSAGAPLIYLEDCEIATFSASRFELCTGRNFIEIYDADGEVEAVGFSGCAFVGNRVDYFVGTDILPLVEGCEFGGDNSFGADWALNSVAYRGDDAVEEGETPDEFSFGGGQAGAPAFYAHHASGLGFSYPADWELQDDGGGRVGVFAPSGDALVVFVTVYEVPRRIDPFAQPAKVFASASDALRDLLEKEMEVRLEVALEGSPREEAGIMTAWYVGEATRAKGERGSARVRLVYAEGSIHALVAMARDAEALRQGGEADLVLVSADYLPKGE